ncbi:hypothetical protein O6H91_01G145000 [Diphasiastrum complanatum]|nr:hypothetical protein O6H91_01G145000 [Diphasiastrum complanatum]KAJ7571009.1 hypothetical protein O6H91_01G145000 [Diphasiastrum complanatum]KAJ7571011.1 hypothetical protein O6H91_01G145000 [Diphasiastrum complanatum]
MHDEHREFTKDGSLDFFGRPAIRSKTGGWKSASFVLGYQILGTITYFGVATNLVLYLRKELHLTNAAAANAATTWSGTSYITSLVGAFIGDAYLGRYGASVLFVAIHFLGTLLLTLQAALPSLQPKSNCGVNSATECTPPSSSQKAFLYTALYISALGAGGHQPCMTALGADQFDDEYPPEQSQKSSYFSYFFVASLVGSLFVTIVLSYIEENKSYALGFGVSTATIGLAGILFVAGIPFYRHFKPGGNPFARAAQVLVAALRKWNVRPPSNSDLLFELHDQEASKQGSRRIFHSKGFRFLDKAATKTPRDGANDSHNSPWILCTVTQVEEVKCLIRMVPIWACMCVYQLVTAQATSTFVEQGAVMDTRLGRLNLSPASLFTFYTISVVICTLIYESFLVPFSRRFTGNPKGFTVLQRMSIGLVVAMLGMVAAAVVEIKRLNIVKNLGLTHKIGALAPMSVFWQVPQYFLTGAAEVFTYVGQNEFFYEQSPDGLRGLGSAFSMASVAVGNYLSTLTVATISSITSRDSKSGWLPKNLNEGHLDYFFWLLLAMLVLNLGYFLVCTHFYKYINVQAK